MKKILLGLSILIVVLMVPSAAAQSTSDNTEVNVSISSSGDVEAFLTINADGSVSLTVDGVPVKEEFSNINSAINYLLSKMTSEDEELSSEIKYNTNQIEYNTELIQNNTEMISQNTSIISVHEDKLEIVLANTIYNKKSHDNLENQHKALLESHLLLQADFIALQNGHNNLVTDYQTFLQDNYGKLEENYQAFSKKMASQVENLEKRSNTLENYRTYSSAGALLLLTALGFGFRKNIGGSVNRGARRFSKGARRMGSKFRRRPRTPRKN